MKKVISYIMVIFMSICLITAIILTIASNTILNCDFTLNILNRNDYYGLIDIEVKSGFEGYIKQSGFDEEILKDIYSKEKLKSDIETVIKATYSGEETTIETESLVTNLKNNIDNYLEENDITLNKNEQENMEEYVEKLIEVYEKEVSHSVYLEGMQTIISKTTKVIAEVCNILFAVLAVLAVIIIIINIKDKLNSVKIVCTSILTASLFILLGILLLNLRINIENIIILNTNFSLLVINIIKDIIFRFVITSVVLTVISIVIILLCNMKKMNKKSN